MLESFYKTHNYLVEHLDVPVRRLLMDEINWEDRLIAIKGCRGVGKTTFLLSYAKERWANSEACLYVNCNNFYFAHHTLIGFVQRFVEHGGRCLLLDQAFKYENWSAELRACYERFPQLQIIFSASPVMRLIEGNEDLQDIVKMYNLRGFSFREYLNLQTGKNFQAYTLQEILNDHENIVRDIVAEVNPLWYFSDYLYHGYYPFFLEKRSYEETLLKTMNMMIEVDILLIRQVDITYLHKLRQLLFAMLEQTPCSLNVSKLAETADTSRATVMNYIKYLKDARLLNMLYPRGKQFPFKPTRVYMQNTNLLYTLPERIVTKQALAETFFYNALHACHKIYASERDTLFAVDINKVPSLETIETLRAQQESVTPDRPVSSSRVYFNVADHFPTGKEPRRTTAVSGVTVGKGNMIPLWMFGLLY